MVPDSMVAVNLGLAQRRVSDDLNLLVGKELGDLSVVH